MMTKKLAKVIEVANWKKSGQAEGPQKKQIAEYLKDSQNDMITSKDRVFKKAIY